MGGSRRRRLAWWWVPDWCICWLFALLSAAPLSYASEQSDLIESLHLRLTTISAAATSLQDESANWKRLSDENEQRVTELLSELAALKHELESWQTASEDSQRQVAELKASLEASEWKLTQLSKTWLDSANSWKAVADAERRAGRRWKWIAIFGGIGVFLAGGAVGHALGK